MSEPTRTAPRGPARRVARAGAVVVGLALAGLVTGAGPALAVGAAPRLDTSATSDGASSGAVTATGGTTADAADQVADAADPAEAASATNPAWTEPDRQAQLVDDEDTRATDLAIETATSPQRSKHRAYRVRIDGDYTIVLPAKRSAYTLDDLVKFSPQTITLQNDGSYLISENIDVQKGATLTVSPDEPLTLRLASDDDGFVSIRTSGGRLRLLGTASAPLTVTSWDTTTAQPDTTLADGRAYVLAEGQLQVRHTTLQHLGFWSGRTGGLALSGAGQLSYSTGTALAGEISDTTLEGNAYGFFATNTTGLTLTNVTVKDSLVDGVLLHREVDSAQLTQVTVSGSGRDGVVLSHGAEGSVLSQLTVTGTVRDGVVLDGAALAEGPSAAGSSVSAFGNMVLTASTVSGSGRTGVRVLGGTKVRVIGSEIVGGRIGVRVDHGASSVTVEGNLISEQRSNGVQVDDSTSVEVTGNTIRSAATGLRVENSTVAAGLNTVSGASLHAVSLIGAVAGSTVDGNTLGGQGSSAVDVVRVTDGTETDDLGSNDTTGWTGIITEDRVYSVLSHPMTVLWIVVFAVLLGTAPLRARRTTMGTPYQTIDGSRDGRALIRADQDAAVQAALGIDLAELERRSGARGPAGAPGHTDRSGTSV